MQVENHKEEAPFAHYAELFRNLNPAAVTARLSDVRWDGKEFTLSLLGRAFAIAHPDYAIRALDGGALVLEIGCAQATDVLALGAANGWVNGSCRKDYGSNDRAVLLQKPEKSC